VGLYFLSIQAFTAHTVIDLPSKLEMRQIDDNISSSLKAQKFEMQRNAG
jgi:hypothetical protein